MSSVSNDWMGDLVAGGTRLAMTPLGPGISVEHLLPEETHDGQHHDCWFRR